MPEEQSAPVVQPEHRGFPQLESLNRITNLPLISFGLNFTTGVYGKVKDSSNTIKFVLESAEHTVQKAAQLAEPVVNTFEKPIKLADSVACKSLDIGAKVVETPQKIYNKAVKTAPVQTATDYVKSVSDYGAQKVRSVSDYGAQTVKSVSDYSTQKVNDLYNQVNKKNGEKEETEKETEGEIQAVPERRLIKLNGPLWSSKIKLWETRPKTASVFDEETSEDEKLEEEEEEEEKEEEKEVIACVANKVAKLQEPEEEFFGSHNVEDIESDMARSIDYIRKELENGADIPKEILKHLSILERYLQNRSVVY